MTIEHKRLVSILCWNAFFIIPLWCLSLWAFNGTRYLYLYAIIATFSSLSSFVLYFSFKKILFWYFTIMLLSYLPSMVFGLALNTGALLILAFGKQATPDWIITGTLLFFALYCFFPLKYYHDDYHRTEKDRLKSFDFDNGTYDITAPSIIRGDSFADFYSKSLLSKAFTGIVGLHIIFPISGGAIAIIAGNISKNLQLGIGLAATFLSTILMIQFGIPGVFNAWQVLQLEKKYGKKIRIVWGDED